MPSAAAMRVRYPLQRVCGEHPAQVHRLSDSWIVAEGPLCGGKRRYLESEIFGGRLSARLEIRPPALGR